MTKHEILDGLEKLKDEMFKADVTFGTLCEYTKALDALWNEIEKDAQTPYKTFSWDEFVECWGTGDKAKGE